MRELFSSWRRSRAESGHLMAGLVVMVAVMMLLSTVVFQGWQDVKRRDDEAEMIFRAQEIVRSIDRYRKDRGAPPTSLEQLIEPGSRGQYFARQLYEDPLVEDGQWGLLYLGPNNEIIDPAAVGPGAAGVGLGGMNPSEMDRTRRERLAEHYERRRAKAKERGITLPPRSVTPAQGQPVGGLAIAGVKSLCSKKPFRVYKGRTEYREWLFTYLDLVAPRVPGQRAGRRGQLPTNRGNRPRAPGR